MAEYIELTKENFKEVTSEGIVLVDFWATWCGPCRMIAPVIEKIAKENPQYKICKINVDEEQELSLDFGVRAIPTLMYMKDGEILKTAPGVESEQNILDSLKELE